MTSSSEIGYRIKQLQQVLRNAMDTALRELGLTTPQYAALSALEEIPGASAAEVARYCFVTPQTMTDIVNNLIQAGLVERHTDPNNGRIRPLRLTPDGQTALSDAHQAVYAIEARMVAPLTQTEQDRLLTGINRCIAALEETSETT